MNCNCLEIIEGKMCTRFNEQNRYGKNSVVKVSINEKALMFSDDLSQSQIKTYSTIKIELSNGKKKNEDLLHSYCPWCGKKIENENAETIKQETESSEVKP